MIFIALFSIALLVCIGSIIISGRNGIITSVIAGVLAIIFWIGFSLVTVQDGNVKVPTRFGKVLDKTYTEGLNFKKPWYGTVEVPVARRELNIATGKESSSEQNSNSAESEEGTIVPAASDLTSLSSEGVSISTEVRVPFRINQEYVHVLLKAYGKSDFKNKVFSSLLSFGNSAVRDAVATLPWRESAITKRDTFEFLISDKMQSSVVADLIKNGVPEDIAPKCFIFPAPLVQKVAPPERISIEIGEREAAIEEQGRQKILTSIATEEAERAGKDGAGVKQFLDELGIRNATPSEIAKLMNANANINYSEAFMKSVEMGKVGNVNLAQVPAATSANN